MQLKTKTYLTFFMERQAKNLCNLGQISTKNYRTFCKLQLNEIKPSSCRPIFIALVGIPIFSVVVGGPAISYENNI
jgi:hypothetical protein